MKQDFKISILIKMFQTVELILKTHTQTHTHTYTIPTTEVGGANFFVRVVCVQICVYKL